MTRAWESGDRVRAFVAVDLALDVARRVSEAQRAMRRAADETGLRVGWVSPANLHVTLKFLGGVPREVLTAVADRLARVAEARPGFEVEAAGAGAFPDATRPRVLWVGLRDGGALAALAADVEAAMEALGFPREKRTFHAHVTVGRVKEGGPAEALLAPHATLSFGATRVRDVVLYRSVLRSSGSEHVPIARLALAGAGRPPGEPPKQPEQEHEHAG